MRGFWTAIIILMIACVPGALAQEGRTAFTVYVNGVGFISNRVGDDRLEPCFPLKVSFFHPSRAISHIRMEYPLDTSKFFILPIDGESQLEYHEGVMRDGYNPYMDFIAEDAAGGQHGRIRMSFQAPADPEDNECGDLTS